MLPVSVKKTFLQRITQVGSELSEHQIRGWRAVSAAGFHGQGSHKRNVIFTDTGITHMRNLLGWLRLGWLKIAQITLN